jgi:hypothetical protein
MQAISDLLTTSEPQFIAIGLAMTLSAIAIMLVWHGAEIMLRSRHGLGDPVFELVALLFFLIFGYSMIAFYETPIPGLGISFSNLITDQAAYLMRLLDARALENVFTHLSTLWARFLVPDAWSILANLVYWLLLIAVALAQGLTIGVVAYGLIASAICALLGPLFIPFFLIPKLDFLYWGWLKAFIQYSFIPVVALAYITIGEKFIFSLVTTVPQGVSAYDYPLYVFDVAVIIGTYAFGLIMIPSLTNSLFSGHSHSGGTGFMSAMLRK